MGITVSLLALNIFWIIRQYKTFSCGSNYFYMTLTLAAVLAMHGLVLLRSRPDASILTSSIASLYCLYLQWSALSSDMEGNCNSKLGDHVNTWTQIGLGAGFTMFALFTISGSTKTEDESNLTSEMGGHMMEKTSQIDDRPDDVPELKQSLREQKHAAMDAEEAHVFAISTATILFQLLLMLSAAYYAMLCTNWGELYLYEKDPVIPEDASNSAFWIKLVAMWLTILLYVFSLMAPILFPNRSFD
eukprot:CAMPEP_0170482806 /NCGR_PEP_ID=MMETSP0208-20121228/2658_1 /TAXON_ID=197538 /ORGANISM="Strombidium inclinatum, Strain S3" /LENGTH=244 /DNA_ID=CAMNT_0010755677 /DNA_START=594 /DNA_END=1328 /DNA_ORIENTATION=-